MRRWSNANIGSQYLASATGLSTPLSNSDRGPSEAQAPPRSGCRPFRGRKKTMLGMKSRPVSGVGECDSVDNVADALAIILGIGGKLQQPRQTCLVNAAAISAIPLYVYPSVNGKWNR